jgi:probable HAF family extracellular repeat protein
MVDIGILPATPASSGAARGVSGNGAIVVGDSNSINGIEAFRWTAAIGLQPLGDLPGGDFHSRAFAISDDGSVIAGRAASPQGFQAARWTDGTGWIGLGELPGGIFFSEANAVNHDGSIIVGRSQSASGTEAFIWTSASGMTPLGDLADGPFDSNAYAVSDDGSVVVGESLVGDLSAAFIWQPGTGMRSLQDLLSADYGLDLTGWTLLSARGVSGDGTSFAGFGINPDGNWQPWFASIRTDIPEPATGTLFGLALSTAAALRRRGQHGDSRSQ